ncbi:mechanosensitive ion channel family protein [Permianibacter sp. IMCC34836]|uniref:mechanosensitive ion channel family protein n=1 Tax=Permianibacter fluminis TaxID=2738515 RepID=UPI0015521963|nr:mechanosensitive ion channel family protein [Permianibacter fluminis]NQD37620.1 mechanosensitive ion channel family protein [Permianibacter fluminis]
MLSFAKIWKWLLELTDVAGWITGVLVILGLTALVHWLWRKLHKRVHAKLEQTKTVWDDAFWEALARPATLAIWLIGLMFAFEYIFTERASVMLKVIHNARTLGIIVLICWFLIRLVRSGEVRLIEIARTSTEEGRLDPTTIEAIAKLGRISVFIVMTLIGLQTMGFSISGVLAFGGIGGLAVSFAAKDLLANFFGGLMLYLDRPFAVGDSIRSPDREIEGTVEYIGWRQTRIRTGEKRPLYIPNSIFANIAVENVTRMSNRRIRETIGLRYQDADRLPALITDLRAYLLAHPDIVEDQTFGVWFHQFGDSSLNILVDAHTRAIELVEFYRIKENVLFGIQQLVAKHGADFAFPSRTVYIESGSAPASR